MAFYISANNKPKMIFDVIVVFFTLAHSMKIMYKFSFLGFSSNYPKDPGDIIFDIIALSLNAIFIILNFFHAYIDKLTMEEITSKKKIAKRYFRFWFYIDFIGGLPFEFIYEQTSLINIIRVIRINKIIKCIAFIERLSLKFRHAIAVFRLAFFGILGIFVFACFWYINSHFYKEEYPSKNFIEVYNLFYDDEKLNNINSVLAKNPDMRTPFISMLTCFFFTLTTVTTTGYGDYVSQNYHERLLAIFYMIFGVLFFAFLMSLLMEERNIVGEENQTVEAQKLITQLRKFNKGKTNSFIDKNINKELLHDVVFATRHSRYEQVTKEENFDILPRTIKNELSNYLWKDVFRQMYDYYDLLQEDKNLHTLLCKLSYYFIFKYYKTKEHIYSIDTLVTEVNLIQSGYVDVINYKVNLKKRLKPGDGMGVFYILYNVRPIYAYLAASGVEVISISDENFLNVLAKTDEKYLNKFKKKSMSRFKEIFHLINSSKKRKKGIYNDKNNKNEILIDNGEKEDLKDKKDNKKLKEYELEYKEIRKSFFKLVNNEDYLLGNIEQNESLSREYKDTFKLEEFIISELNKVNK